MHKCIDIGIIRIVTVHDISSRSVFSDRDPRAFGAKTFDNRRNREAEKCPLFCPQFSQSVHC